jgi:hypothetical protein
MKGLAVAVALMAFLQTARERQQLPSVFKSGVDVVQLDVSVVNRNGAPVRGLTAADFIVTDNDARQEVRSVVVDQLALNVQLVLDVSSSVSGRRLARLVAATNGLLDALRPGDGAGLVMFSHLLRAPVEITEDLAVVRSALGGIVGDGRTALRDAIQLAIAKRDDGRCAPLGAGVHGWRRQRKLAVRRSGCRFGPARPRCHPRGARARTGALELHAGGAGHRNDGRSPMVGGVRG